RPVLAQITSQHYGQLDSVAVANMAKALRASNELDSIFILCALEKAGTSLAIPEVERLIQRTHAREVKLAAEQSLAALRARERDENAHQRLLRPSESGHDSSGSLLRPAAGVPQQQPEILLRATGVGSEVE